MSAPAREQMEAARNTIDEWLRVAPHPNDITSLMGVIAQAIADAAEAEREACAELAAHCDTYFAAHTGAPVGRSAHQMREHIAAAIRARKQGGRG